MEQKEKPKYNDWVGRRIRLWLDSGKHYYIVKVMEVGPDGRATKFRATRRQESLGKKGFVKEGDQWVILEWQVCRN